MLSWSVSFMLRLVRNPVSFISQICRVPKWLRLNCEGSATSSRRVRDTRVTLRLFCEEFCRIKFLNMFKIFATSLRHLATLGNTCEQITNHWRLFRDCEVCDPLAMFVASCRKTVAVQWDRGFRLILILNYLIKLCYVPLLAYKTDP